MNYFKQNLDHIIYVIWSEIMRLDKRTMIVSQRNIFD